MAAARIALLVFAAVLLCALAATPAGSTLTQEELRKMFHQNLVRFHSFPCKQPQQRSVMVGELLLRGGQLSPSQTVVPPATVLHLCGPSTGCCYTSDKVCAPQLKDNVTLTFRVQDILRGSEFSDLSIVFVNHTRCVCESKTEDIHSEDVVWNINSVP